LEKITLNAPQSRFQNAHRSEEEEEEEEEEIILICKSLILCHSIDLQA
jgi:hypothetical protein